jgi:hypothetical protein
MLRRAPAKQCDLDPAPTWLLKKVGNVIAPTIAITRSLSIHSQSLPCSHKKAIVRPWLKKSSLNPNDPASYSPISNLSFISRIVEWVVDDRLTDYVNQFNMMTIFQSAYRRFYSTETAAVSINSSMIEFLVLLD